ncbi:MAG: GNAT family N-acetyltransferase [Chitinispirillales bacterium]|jgi:GNAT superfamily N-acetyltransferase|nr:GNAT family N-acetyltransferase [Chitinispirillales bacterium]
MAVKASDITIRPGNESDCEPVVALLNTNFRDTPFFTWAVDDPDERSKVASGFYRLHMKLGLKKGTVHIAENSNKQMVGAAIWSPNNSLDDEAYNEIQGFAGVHTPRIQLLIDTLRKSYPPVDRYEHLMWISIHPAAHGGGVGSKLINHRLSELDKMGVPAYLEATTRLAGLGIYERMGFLLAGAPIRLPGGLQWFPMWRSVRKPSVAPAANELGGDGHETDKMMQFGGRNWRVLDVQDGKALLLSERVMEMRRYHEKYEDTTWADCTLRQYLNETFYNTFSEADRSRILETQLSNKNNPWFGTNGGRDTADKIFLLSVEEAVKYLGDSGACKNRNPNAKYAINDDFNDARRAISSDSQSVSWWLRSPGLSPDFASAVTEEGFLGICGDFVNRGSVVGYRPAMWVSV